MNEIRMGIAGLGGRALGWVNLNLLRIPGYRITAIYDFIPERHAPMLALIPYRQDVKCFTDWREFLAYQGMDAVGLCVRCKEQGRMAAEVLEAGKHVHAEVPAAHTLEDCWRIVTAAERNPKLVYLLAEQTRYAGFVEAWTKMIAEGQLGKIVYLEGEYFGYYGEGFLQEFVPGTKAPNWARLMPVIHYLPHNLSPALKCLGGARVQEVVGMSVYGGAEAPGAATQVALMKTTNDCILRMATCFAHPVQHSSYHHWFRVKGTKGILQLGFTPEEKPRMWLADRQMFGFAEVDWRLERPNAPSLAHKCGHHEMDYYVHADFRDAVLHGRPPELDVYGAMDTAAPAILAADSIDQHSRLLTVPDFHPRAPRPAGRMPKDVYQGV